VIDVVILGVVILVPFFRTEARVTSPFGYICGFVGFMFIGKYFWNQWLGVPFLEGADPAELASHFRALAAYLGIAFVLALPFCNPPRSRADRAGTGNPPTTFTLNAAALFLLIAVPALLVGLGVSIGLNPISNPLAFRQFTQSQGMFYILSVYIFLMSAISIYVPYMLIAQRRRPHVMFIAAYVVTAAFALVSGFASMIVSMITVPLFFWSVCYRKRIELGLLFLLPVVIAFTVLYSAYRDVNLSGSGVSLSDAIVTVTENPQAAKQALNRFDYLENFAKAHRYLQTRDPDWGTSLLDVFVQPVPRAFWPQKPENFSTSMTRELLPQNLAIGVTANFNSLNEFVMAFGGFGILIGGVVLAFILVVSYCVFDAAVDEPYLAAYYAIVLFKYIGIGFYAGFVNDLAFDDFLLENVFFLLFIRKREFEPGARPIRSDLVPAAPGGDGLPQS
jgi:hypothetical protein